MHRRLGSLSGRSTINNLTTPDPPAGRPAGRAWDEDDDDDEEALYQRASDGESDDDAMSEEEDETPSKMRAELRALALTASVVAAVTKQIPVLRDLLRGSSKPCSQSGDSA